MSDARPRVLVVEDDATTADTLRRYLEREGYTASWAASGVEALEVAEREQPDVVLLDVMLPELDGIAVCRRLRATRDVAVLMVSARVTEADFIRGLDAGADDYIAKPFRPREVMARVRAALRRGKPVSADARGQLTAGDLVVTLDDRRVVHANCEVSLTPTEYALLIALMRHPQRVFTREQLIAEALGHDYSGYDRTIDTHVLNLRRKVDPGRTRITTVFGVGYRFDGGDA